MNSKKLFHFSCICVYCLHLFDKIVEHIIVTKQFQILVWRQTYLVVAGVLHENLFSRHLYHQFFTLVPSFHAYLHFSLLVEPVLQIVHVLPYHTLSYHIIGTLIVFTLVVNFHIKANFS